MREPLDRTILSRADGVEAEILQDKAATLERLGGRLDDALRRLRIHDESAGPRRGDAREALVDSAAEALWYYVVQREVCGIRGTEQLLRELGVPREVQLRMGIRRKRAGP